MRSSTNDERDAYERLLESMSIPLDNYSLCNIVFDDWKALVKLRNDNIKLRELVQDMWRFTGAACKKYPRLFDPAAQGGQMVQLNTLDSFEQRMRELGIEVPE